MRETCYVSHLYLLQVSTILLICYESLFMPRVFVESIKSYYGMNRKLIERIIESVQIIERRRMLELIHGIERTDTINVFLVKSN